MVAGGADFLVYIEGGVVVGIGFVRLGGASFL